MCGDDADFTEEDFHDQIYKFSHIGVGICSNPHDDWKDELNKLYNRLKKAKQLGGVKCQQK